MTQNEGHILYATANNQDDKSLLPIILITNKYSYNVHALSKDKTKRTRLAYESYLLHKVNIIVCGFVSNP